jgi:hypothetical protein
VVQAQMPAVSVRLCHYCPLKGQPYIWLPFAHRLLSLLSFPLLRMFDFHFISMLGIPMADIFCPLYQKRTDN